MVSAGRIFQDCQMRDLRQQQSDCTGHYGETLRDLCSELLLQSRLHSYRAPAQSQSLPASLCKCKFGSMFLAQPRPANRLSYLHTTFLRQLGFPTGYIQLQLPVFHIGYFKNTRELLCCICKTCARVLLQDEDRQLRLK